MLLVQHVLIGNSYRVGTLVPFGLGNRQSILASNKCENKNQLIIVQTLCLTNFLGSALAQTVFIPDPGLSIAIHEELGNL